MERIPPSQKTDEQWLKDNGYANLTEFMLDYDCEKPHKPEEGKELLIMMRDIDQLRYEKQAMVTKATAHHLKTDHLDYAEIRKLPEFKELSLRDVPYCDECGWGVDRRVVL